MKRPLIGIAILFSLGILMEHLLAIPPAFLYLYILFFLSLTILFIKSKTRFLIFAGICFLFLGALAFENYTAIPQNHITRAIQVAPDFPKIVVVEGKILDNPRLKKTYYGSQEAQFLLRLNAIRDKNEWKTVSGILSVNCFNPPLKFRYADQVILEGHLAPPRPAANPGQFDYKKFLERRRIFYLLNVREDNFSKIIGHGFRNPIRLLAYKLRDKIGVLIDRFMPDESGGILKAVFLGEPSDVDADINSDFVKTRTVHVLPAQYTKLYPATFPGEIAL